jgi:hypothetical protein
MAFYFPKLLDILLLRFQIRLHRIVHLGYGLFHQFRLQNLLLLLK